MSGLPVAILAGGLGTRLGELCRDKPKPLAEVAGEPFIHHQLRLLSEKGLEEAVILAGYLGEMISDSVGDGAKFGLKVSYSFDWPDLLGTGGAVFKALPLLTDKFMVLYGDSYLDLDYLAAVRSFESSGQPALMTVYKNDNLQDRSNVLYQDGSIKLYDKKNRTEDMSHIDYGLSCFKAEAFRDFAHGLDCPPRFDLADLCSSLSREGRLAGFLVEERFYEIGSLSGLKELDELLTNKKRTGGLREMT
ncbi:MAG: NTP transferase domain-containing protein [Deltaproteobacteria bacterium]|nr:NTP transferase domain-containing protein [Deltaproteobacteria bacterium]